MAAIALHFELERPIPLEVYGGLALATIVFIVATWRVPLALDRDSPLILAPRRGGWLRLGAVVLVAFLGLAVAVPIAFEWSALAMTGVWLLLLIALIWVTARLDVPAAPIAGYTQADWLAVGSLLIVGAALRLYRIWPSPLAYGISDDLAGLLTMARDDLLGGRVTNIFSATSQLGNTYYQVAGYVPGLLVFGSTYAPAVAYSIVVGLATIVAVFALARLWFGALSSWLVGALVAVASWHLSISRTGYDLVEVPFWVCAITGPVVLGARSGRRWHFVLGGIALGLAMGRYASIRTAPIAIGLLFIFLLVRDRGRWRSWLTTVAYFWGAALVAVAPQALSFLRDPEPYLVNYRIVSVANQLPADQQITATLTGAWKILTMFSVEGETYSRLFNVNGLPMADPITAALILLGTAVAITRIVRARAFTLVAWTVVVVLFAAFTDPPKQPVAGRATHLVVLAAMFAGFAFEPVRVAWRSAFSGPIGRMVPVFAAGAIIAGAAAINLERFFVDIYGGSPPPIYNTFEPARGLVGKSIGQVGRGAFVYFFGYERFGIQSSSIQYFADGSVDGVHVRPHLAVPATTYPPSRDVLYMVMPDDWAMLDLLRRFYPAGVEHHHTDWAEIYSVGSYRVPQADVAARQQVRVSYFADVEPSGTPLATLDAPPGWLVGAGDPPMAPLDARSMRVEARLIVPEYGEYRFGLAADGRARVLIDGQRVAESTALIDPILLGERVLLAEGSHDLRVEMTGDLSRSAMRVVWQAREGEVGPMPPGHFSLPEPIRAFHTTYRATGNATDVIRVARLTYLRDWTPPMPSTTEYDGALDVVTPGEYVLEVHGGSGRASIEVDGVVRLADAEIRDQAAQVTVTLAPGKHRLLVRRTATEETLSSLYWTPPGGVRSLIPSSAIAPIQVPS